MFHLIILVIKLFIMNSTHFKRSSDHEYPAIELDMTNFMEYLSEEYFSGNAEVKNDDAQTNLKITDCKTEDCADLREISSNSGIEFRDEKVRKFDEVCCV